MNSNHLDLLLTPEEFKKSEEKIHNDISELRQEFNYFKTEFEDFKKEFREEIRTEFSNKLKNIEISITIKLAS